MGLVNLLTDLSQFRYYTGKGYTGNGDSPGMKSLKYGNDQLGGGNSGQPYIQVPIPDGFNDLQLSNNDFILRGGALAFENSTTDVLRLGKMFADTKSPGGLSFVAKQNLLSRTAVRTQTSGILNEGAYSPLSTLAEAGLVASGGHILKQGLNPFRGTGAYSNNSNLYGVKIKPNQPSAENRLVNLYQAQQINFTSEPFGDGVTLNKGNVNILSYTGGPGSILGVGSTNIRYAEGQQTGLANGKNSTGLYYGPLTWTPSISNAAKSGNANIINQINNNILSGNFISLQSYSNNIVNNVYLSSTSYTTPTQYTDNLIDKKSNPLLVTQTPQPGVGYGQQFSQNTFTYTQGNINDQNANALGSPTIQDFRTIIRSKLLNLNELVNSTGTGATPITPNYSGSDSQAYEKRVNIGGTSNLGPGYKTGKNLVSYTYGSGIGPVDKLNAKGVYPNDTVKLNSDEYPVNDLVKFRIAVISNENPNVKTFIHFRAFIDNFSDSYNANWNPVTYLGRGENFYTYSNYTRAISMGWTVAAQSKEELIPMYKKLNFLASSLTPDYTSKGYMAGNLVQLTIGGYLYETVGIINSITYDIPEESPWEISINGEGESDDSVKELSHIIRVTNFSFTPIQDFIPSVQPVGNQDGLSRYISLANGEGSNNTNYKDQVEELTFTGTEKTEKPKPKGNRIPLPKPKINPKPKTNPKANPKLNPNPPKNPSPKKIIKPTKQGPPNPFVQTPRAVRDNVSNRTFGAFAPREFRSIFRGFGGGGDGFNGGGASGRW